VHSGFLVLVQFCSKTMVLVRFTSKATTISHCVNYICYYYYFDYYSETHEEMLIVTFLIFHVLCELQVQMVFSGNVI